MCKRKKVKEKKVIYYSDILNDDFAGTNIHSKPIDKNYKYIRKNIVWRFFARLLYLLVLPIISFYEAVLLGVRFKNGRAVRKLKKACFLYGNHTAIIDAYTSPVLSGLRGVKVLANPDAVSIKGIRTFVQMLGALPVANDYITTKNMLAAVEHYYKKGDNIAIFPEAHIWKYYTGVRPFKDSSFYYPVKLNAPVVAFFTAYSKPTGLFRKLKKADITVYVSDPIYPDLDKPLKIAQRELRNKVYAFMNEMSEKHSDYAVIEYVYKEKKD